MTAVPFSKALTSHERIERRFGSYGVDVIESDGRRRVSSLYSLTDGEKVCRTYATVHFARSIDPAFAEEHARVIKGQSIAAVFESAGWTIGKRHAHLGETSLTDSDNPVLRLMKIDNPQRLAIHSYVFEIARNHQSFDYADITELHHPDYLTAAAVIGIYDGIDTVTQASVIGAG